MVSPSEFGLRQGGATTPQAQTEPIVYRPFGQSPPAWMYVTVEGATNSGNLFAAIRRAVWSVDPDQPLEGASGGPWTLGEMLSDRSERPRLIVRAGNDLAAIALLLATIGVYGLLSYAEARRTSEFGVRVALGASTQKVMSLVLQRTLTLAGLGIAVGFGAAAAMTRFIEGMLFGVTPIDVATFFGAGLVFLTLSVLASLVPVRRAMTVSPLVVLRTD